MAHMSNGKGPYPDKAGEFCGNFLPRTRRTPMTGGSQAEADRHQREWLDRMRFGQPSNCPQGTSQEMADKGWVGLYLKEDRSLFDWEVPFETNELREDFVIVKSRLPHAQ